MGHLPVGGRGNDLRIGLEPGNAQEAIMVWRLFRRRNPKPLVIGVKHAAPSLALEIEPWAAPCDIRLPPGCGANYKPRHHRNRPPVGKQALLPPQPATPKNHGVAGVRSCRPSTKAALPRGRPPMPRPATQGPARRYASRLCDGRHCIEARGCFLASPGVPVRRADAHAADAGQGKTALAAQKAQAGRPAGQAPPASLRACRAI